MKKLFLFLFLFTGLTLYGPSSQAGGPTVFVNLGPYGAVGYPGGYAYPVNNGCCGGCASAYPASYYPYNNYPPAYGPASYNPYVFDTANSPWVSNAGRMVPVRMNPRNPYGY